MNKEAERYLDGLLVLFYVINHEHDIDKASNIIHDLLLDYDVVRDYQEEYDRGYKSANEIFTLE